LIEKLIILEKREDDDGLWSEEKTRERHTAINNKGENAVPMQSFWIFGGGSGSWTDGATSY
jgi:hypothetical protein